MGHRNIQFHALSLARRKNQGAWFNTAGLIISLRRKPHLQYKDEKGNKRILTHDEMQLFIDTTAIALAIGYLIGYALGLLF